VDHYERLAVARDAGARQIARAFRRAARRAHPDAGGSAEDFAAVAEAYRVLSDAHLRAEYDRELDGVAADWADVAWGAEVGGDAPAGVRRRVRSVTTRTSCGMTVIPTAARTRPVETPGRSIPGGLTRSSVHLSGYLTRSQVGPRRTRRRAYTESSRRWRPWARGRWA
jgi:curved DNA-binding protein CbpA